MTQGPQEELKAVKARARKAAEKARAQIAKEKQTVMVLARDADRAREEARKAREEAAQYKECYSRMIEVANNAVATQAELIKAHRIAREEADRLLLENTRLSRELKRRDRTVVCDWDSSKIWEISLN